MNRRTIFLVGLLLVTVPVVGCVDQGTQPDGGADDGTSDGDGTGDQAAKPAACLDQSREPGSVDHSLSPTAGVSGAVEGVAEDGLNVRVRQDPGNTVYWVKPGPRELSQQVFGTENNPRMTGQVALEKAKGPIKQLLQDIPFMVGVPEDARTTQEDGSQILETPTLFSDKGVPTSGALDVTYKDRQPYDLPGKPGNTKDKAELSSSLTDPSGNKYRIEIDHIVQPPIPGYQTGGGVLTNAWHHGQTGTGSPLMPQVYTYGAFWAIVDVYINDDLVNEHYVGHFMTTQNVRHSDYSLALDEELPLDVDDTPTGQEHHTHGVVFPIKATDKGPIHEPLKTCVQLPNGQTQPFIHGMWEEDEILQGPHAEDGGDGLEVTVEQDAEKTFYWVTPGERRLSPWVFGTKDEPRTTGQWQIEAAADLPHGDTIQQFLKDTPPAVGAPTKARKTLDDGTQVFKPKTLFSDNAIPLQDSSNPLKVTYQDKSPWDSPGPPGKVGDAVDIDGTTFHDPQGNEYKITINHLVKPPIPGYETGDSVITNAFHHGRTGTGSPLMPISYTYGAFWALADLHVRNGTTGGQWEKIDSNHVTHFMTTETVRKADYSLAIDEELPLPKDDTPTGKIHHTHGVMFPFKGTPNGPVHEPLNTSFVLPNGQKQPFIHAMWEDETLVKHPFKGYQRRDISQAGGGGGDGGGQSADVEVTITATDFDFSQDQINASAGDTVKVTLQNAGENQHNWGVDLDGDGDVRDDAWTGMVGVGDTGSVTFTVTESGESPFICDVSGHRQLGMEGTLVVE